MTHARQPSRDASPRGQGLVEFALVLPLLLLLLVTAIDFGRAYLGWINLNLAAREAANFAALNPRAWVGGGDEELQDRYAELVTNDTTSINCTMPAAIPGPTFPSGAVLGGAAVVELGCSFDPITPLVSAIVGDAVQISASAVFPIRTGAIAQLPTSGGGGGVNPIPVANFAGDQLVGVAPLMVTFTDLSSNAPEQWAWTFGDGGISANQNPLHLYADSGTYTVSMTASNVNGSDTEIKLAYITVTEPPPGPTADFTFSPTTGEAPLDVSFVDASSGDPVSWAWDFGDGATSNLPNPSHRFDEDMTYVVRLTVTNPEGSSFVEKTITVVAPVCIVPNFAGVKKSAATEVWTDAGFTGDIVFLDASSNDDYKIDYQSLPGGTIPAEGCAASIEVGPK
jgi:PKD repeat protein